MAYSDKQTDGAKTPLESPATEPSYATRAPKLPRRRMGRVWFFVLKWAVLLLAIAALAVAIWAYVKHNLLPGGKKQEVALTDVLPDSLEGLLPDETLGYNALDFQNAVLGETREKSSLVVMEQDVQIDTVIKQTFANIELFAKTQNVHSFGTGVYTVDLSGLMGESVIVDLENKLVTVTIPQATLGYVEADVSRTEFEDTQRGLLAFTDISMTPEQQTALTGMIEDEMRKRLSEPDLLQDANENARTNVHVLLAPLVAAVSGDFTVQVVTG